MTDLLQVVHPARVYASGWGYGEQRKRRPRVRSALNRQPLEVGGEVVQPARAILGDDDGLGEYAAGFAVAPFRIEQVDVHGEHHAGAEFVADRRKRPQVGALGVVAVAGIFERRQSVPVDASFADAEAAP